MVAPSLIEFFYGPQFEESALILRILAVHVPLAAMDTVLATALIAADRLKKYVVVAGVAAVVNPFAFWIAIRLTEVHYDNGAIGAAIVTVATEVFITVCAFALRPPGVLDGTALRMNVRILVASAVMIPVLLLAGSLPLFVQIALGAITYAAAALLFRAITRRPSADRPAGARCRRSATRPGRRWDAAPGPRGGGGGGGACRRRGRGRGREGGRGGRRAPRRTRSAASPRVRE